MSSGGGAVSFRRMCFASFNLSIEEDRCRNEMMSNDEFSANHANFNKDFYINANIYSHFFLIKTLIVNKNGISFFN